jgi:hypothetical protein
MLNYNQNTVNQRQEAQYNNNMTFQYNNFASQASSNLYFNSCENIKQEPSTVFTPAAYCNNTNFTNPINYPDSISGDSTTSSSVSYASSPVQSNQMDFTATNGLVGKHDSYSELDLSDGMFDDSASFCDSPPVNRGGRKQVKTGTTKRNARERNRVRYINNCFEVLRERIPFELVDDQKNRKLSKVETLKYATIYIKRLTSLLNGKISSNENVNMSSENNVVGNIYANKSLKTNNDNGQMISAYKSPTQNSNNQLIINNKILNKNTSNNISFNNININIYDVGINGTFSGPQDYGYVQNPANYSNNTFVSVNQAMYNSYPSYHDSYSSTSSNSSSNSSSPKQFYFNCSKPMVMPSLFATTGHNRWV